jgi:hypothetical protein
MDSNTLDQSADIAVQAGGSGPEESAGLRAEHLQIAVLLAQDDGVLAMGCGCAARDEGGHHSEVGVEARFLGTDCRVACVIRVLHGTGGATGNDPRVEGG